MPWRRLAKGRIIKNSVLSEIYIHIVCHRKYESVARFNYNVIALGFVQYKRMLV